MSIVISDLGAEQATFWEMFKSSAGEVGQETKKAIMEERVPQRTGAFITRQIVGGGQPVPAVYVAPPPYIERGKTNWVLIGGVVAVAAIVAAMLLGKE